MSDNKYKVFRNFMVNELGITREDIKEWTMQAVQETVEKILRGVKVEDLVYESVRRIVTRDINEFSFARDVMEKVAYGLIKDKLKISIELKEDANAVKKS